MDEIRYGVLWLMGNLSGLSSSTGWLLMTVALIAIVFLVGRSMRP